MLRRSLKAARNRGGCYFRLEGETVNRFKYLVPLVLVASLAYGTARADWVSTGWSYYDEYANVDPGSGGGAGYTFMGEDPYLHAYMSFAGAQALAKANYVREWEWQGDRAFGIFHFDFYGKVVGTPAFVEQQPGASFSSWVLGIVARTGPTPQGNGYIAEDHLGVHP